MAQLIYPIDLDNTAYPMLSEQQRRTVMGGEVGKAPSADDRPSVAYMHNVMPTRQGLGSIGYLPVISAIAGLPAGAVMVDARIVYGSDRGRLHLAWDTLGNVYVLLPSATAWLALPATVPATAGAGFSPSDVTIGTVNGVSYIFYKHTAGFIYNESTNVLDEITFSGLSIPDIEGIVASSGYLLAYTTEAIAWSSTIDSTDFTPSAATGAGGGSVAGTKGDILFCSNNTLGILIYSDTNTVAGTYTGNKQFPFKFREVDGSKGGLSEDSVAYEANSASQFVYSKAGMQSVTSKEAKNILAQVTDFLAGSRFEDFNESTLLYEVTNLTTPMKKKIKYIASRYLVISYGITEFTHALVWDTALEKTGKLRITHGDVFEYIGDQTEVSKQSIAFLLPNGEVQAVDFSRTSPDSSGVVVLGKLQARRLRLVTLLRAELENVAFDSQFDLYTQAALDGKNFTNVQGTVAHSEGDLREYVFRSTATNHSLVAIGKFEFNTVQITYTEAGRR